MVALMLLQMVDERFSNRASQQPMTQKGFSMATENEQRTATQPTSKEEEHSSSRTGLARSSNDATIARHHRPGPLSLPITPFEMLRMTPFSLFRRMTEEFDRVLQPFLSEDEAGASIAWTPTVEISERDGKYRILAELPGLSPDEVRVEVENDALILQGERQVEQEATERGIRRSERQFGFFYRRIPLPEGADPEQAKAKFHDGMLEITIPVPDRQAQRRQIQIEADSKPSADQTKQAA
jgi:HSP20 family protein